MAIKARCGNCKSGFTAKDALAGRLVKCPKCKKQMQIPAKAAQPAQAVAAATPAAHNPLLDLLDEAGVEAMPRGPVCENCGSGIGSNAIICVQCGYNMATGQQIETAVFDDDQDEANVPGMTDAEKILARAEKEIEDMPVTSYGQNFGDGSESILIAGVAICILVVLVGIGVGTIFLMDQLGDVVKSSLISFWASMTLALGCAIWITMVAFLSKTTQGIICVCTGGLYCIIFGFMQGRSLLVPTIILCAALFIGLVSSFFAFAEDNQYGMLFMQYFG